MKGAEAEARAEYHLARLGRTILARNYRIRGGEIDIVSRCGTKIFFSEVRHRSTATHGSALESITRRKLALMHRAAQEYLLRELGTEDVFCCLEVITIDGDIYKSSIYITSLD